MAGPDFDMLSGPAFNIVAMVQDAALLSSSAPPRLLPALPGAGPGVAYSSYSMLSQVGGVAYSGYGSPYQPGSPSLSPVAAMTSLPAPAALGAQLLP
jgi:hypothetical protein